MPDSQDPNASAASGGPLRTGNLPVHAFVGGNTWVPRIISGEYSDTSAIAHSNGGIGRQAELEQSALWARQMLASAAELEASLTAFTAPAHQPPMTLAQRVQRVYLAWLATHPDSHIVRKQGAAVARAVSAEAAHWRDRLASAPEAADGADFAAWDESLKARGLNPGTSADLVVCTVFVAALLTPALWTQGAGALDTVYGRVREGACAGPMEQSLLSS